MKKTLLLTVVLMLGAAVANAATVYFKNTKNWSTVYMYSWTGNSNNQPWPGVVMTETVEKDGVTYFKGETYFNNVIFNNNSGSQTGDLRVIDDMIYDGNGETGESFGGGIIEVPDEVYLSGENIDSWNGSDPAYKFTETGDGVYTFSIASLTGNFKIVANGAWLGTTTPVKSGEEYTLSDIGMAQMTLAAANATNVNLTFVMSTKTLKVTYDGGDTPITGSNIYLSGEFNSWNVNDAAYKFTEGENGIYTLSLESLTGNFKVVNDGNWLGTTTPVESGVEYVLTDIGYQDMALAAEEGKNVTLTFNPTSNMLVVTYDGAQIDYTTWYVNVIGDFNNWEDNGVNPDEDGIATLPELAIGTSGFKVKIWNGADNWHSNGSAIAQNEWVATPWDDQANMTIADAMEGDVFTVSYDCKTNQIMVVKTGNVSVEGIEAADNGEAVYFNLQGVKVAEPQMGLYIKVQNGKATKVVVK